MRPFLPLFLILLFGCKGFNTRKIHSNLPHQSQWEIALPQDEKHPLEKIFSQKFHYLGNGAQCYAFISQDQKYVLKFFKMKHLLAKNWLCYLPFNWIENYRFKKVTLREKRLHDTFGAHKMAYDHFKEDAGLVFIHLNKTQYLNKTVVLVDKRKKEWLLDLNTTVFILQEKADPVYSRISHLIESGNIQGAKSAIQAVLHLAHSRCQKGFVDLDSGFNNNYGFVGNRPIQIDVGRIVKTENSEHFDEVDRLTKWLQRHYPQLLTREANR